MDEINTSEPVCEESNDTNQPKSPKQRRKRNGTPKTENTCTNTTTPRSREEVDTVSRLGYCLGIPTDNNQVNHDNKTQIKHNTGNKKILNGATPPQPLSNVLGRLAGAQRPDNMDSILNIPCTIVKIDVDDTGQYTNYNVTVVFDHTNTIKIVRCWGFALGQLLKSLLEANVLPVSATLVKTGPKAYMFQ